MNWRSLLRHETILALLLVVTIAVLSQLSDKLLTVDNLLNQGRLMTEIGLISLAMTFVIVTGGIDLSVGSTAGLVAILTGIFSHDFGIPMPLTVVLGLAVGALCGAVNGVIITYFRTPPLIATLATLALFRGLAEGISKGRQVRNYPDWFLYLGSGDFLGVPTQVWLLGIAAIVAAVLLGLTTFGRATYAIGSNEVAAKFSGLSVDRTKILIYAGSGTLAALAGILLVARVTTTRSDMGNSWELQAITAVVLGGTSIFGGRGTIIGTVLGLILVQILQNGLLLAGMGALRGWISGGDSTIVVVGAALILTVLVSNLFGGRREA